MFAKLRKATISFIMSVRPTDPPSAWNNSALTGRIFMKFDIWVFLEYLSRKFKFHSDALHEDLCKCKTVSRCILLRIGNISDKIWRENQNAFYVQQLLFAPENRALYEIVWKYTVEPDRCHMKINVTWPLHFACWINKATDIHSKYVKLDSWVKRDQLDVTCFIISLFNAQNVSDVNTSILGSLRIICWVISWVVLLWFDVCWCYVVVWLWWCGIRMQVEALLSVVLQPTYG